MRKVFQWTCWCLLFMFPTSLLATDVENVAMLSGSGTVQINGTSSPRTSTVFAGDRVATAKDSSVTLTSKGRTIILPEDSSVTYGGKRVRLEYGQVFINTQPGTEAQLGNLTISPAETNAQIEMRSSGSNMVLVARAGSLSVTDGTNNWTLASGQTMMTDDPKDQIGEASTAAPTPTYRKRRGGWIILGGGAAALGGLMAIRSSSSSTHNSSTNVLSPSQP